MDITPDLVGTLGRVVGIEADDSRLYVLLQTGVYVDLYADSEAMGIDIGDILMVASDLSEVRPAPKSLWPSRSWIAVVRHVAEDLIVVTGPGGGWRLIPVSAVRCRPGNTVECDETAGVLRLIRDDPLPDLEIAEKGRRQPSEFKVNLGSQTESFEDFAGQPGIVARARELIELPLAKRELLDAIGAPPVSGVLLTGPPGTGKTMLSRIIARASGATLYLIRGPESGADTTARARTCFAMCMPLLWLMPRQLFFSTKWTAWRRLVAMTPMR